MLVVSGNIDIAAWGFPTPGREVNVSVTPQSLELAVITNLTEHFVESSGFILIVDGLTSCECEDIALDLGE